MIFSSELESDLLSIYEEIMWLSTRPNVTPGRARGWYTHIMAEHVKRKVRRFSGMVSSQAIKVLAEPLVLEHFKRIQTTLSGLVEKHGREGVNPQEFLQIINEYEQVHIVTRSENYSAMRAKGDYITAGIQLQPWESLPVKRQQELWRSMLKGKVANESDFKPKAM